MSDTYAADTADDAAAGSGPDTTLPTPDAPAPDASGISGLPQDVPDFLQGALGGLIGEAIRSIRPPPPAPNEPFQPGPLRPHTQWGKPDHILEAARRYPGVSPGPHMPQGGDIQALLQRTLSGLARSGSPKVAMLARSIGGMNDRWVKDFIAGREAGLRLQDHEMKRNLEALEREQGSKSEEYGVAFSRFDKVKDGARLLQELWKIANAHNDGPMKEMLLKNDLDGAYKLNQANDHNLLSLMKYASQRDKLAEDELKRADAEQKRADAERKREEVRTWLGGGSATSPPDAALPTATTDAGGGAWSLPPSPPRIDAAARDRIMDRKPHVLKDPTVEGAVDDRENAIAHRLDQIAEDPGLKGKAVIDAVRAVHPELAGQLQSYIDGKLTVPGGKEGASGHMQRIIALGAKVDPSVNPETGKIRQATIKDFTSGNDGRNLSSIGTAFRHMNGLKAELAGQMPAVWNQLLGESRWTSWLPLPGSEEDKKKIGALNGRISTALSEYERALIGGKPTVSGRKAAEELADWRNKDITVVRTSIDTLIEQLRDRLQEQKDRFLAGTGGKDADGKPIDMLSLFDRNLGKADPAASAGLHELESAPPAPATPPAAPAASGAPVKVNSPAEAAALPPGTLYVAPDGKTRRR